MNTHGSTIKLLLSSVVFILIGVIQTQAQCNAVLTPNSQILSESDQALVANWLAEEFQFEAELVFDSHTATIGMSDFHDACDGLSNTLVVAISEEGNICGGYNEGTWSSVQETISGLDNNFLFSVSNEEVYPAITGGQHLANDDFLGPVFGSGGALDMRIAQIGTGVGFLQNNLGTNYECPAANPDDCDAYFNDGMFDGSFEDRFLITRWEVWQLKTSGTALSQDTDNDGICDAEEIEGCQDPAADNYDEMATDAGPCEFPFCEAELMPGSGILSLTEQTLLASWLPAGFEYEAELIMDSEVSGFANATFHSLCDGVAHTVLVAVSSDDRVFGGYNEGAWGSDGQLQFDLDQNFLFSITNEEKYNAIPGQPHIRNGSFQGPTFGDADTRDYFTFNSTGSSVIVENNLGNSYECPEANLSSCEAYLNDGIGNFGAPNRMTVVRWEIWALNTSGTSYFSDNNNGGCKDITAINYNSLASCENNSCLYAGCTNATDVNYNPEASFDDGSCETYNSCPGDLNGDLVVTVGDLSGFLAAFGNLCD